MLDLAFDPLMHDEIDDGHGSPVLTDKADTAVQLAMLVHYGEAWQDPEMGSRFHDLDTLQADPARLATVEAERVLERLVSQGRIADPTAIAEFNNGTGQLVVATTFRDRNTGQVVSTKVRAGG